MDILRFHLTQAAQIQIPQRLLLQLFRRIQAEQYNARNKVLKQECQD